MSNGMFGVNIVSSPMAREVRDEWVVKAHSIRKRRRSWCVVRVHIDRPGAYQCGNVIYMHPDLIAKLPRTLEVAK